jgi:hypothetical protein
MTEMINQQYLDVENVPDNSPMPQMNSPNNILILNMSSNHRQPKPSVPVIPPIKKRAKKKKQNIS